MALVRSRYSVVRAVDAAAAGSVFSSEAAFQDNLGCSPREGNKIAPALIVGGVADHVHILCQLAKTQSVSDIMEHLKAFSSKWLKTEGSRTFSWQRGYGAFSVSQSHVEAVISYIETTSFLGLRPRLS